MTRHPFHARSVRVGLAAFVVCTSHAALAHPQGVSPWQVRGPDATQQGHGKGHENGKSGQESSKTGQRSSSDRQQDGMPGARSEPQSIDEFLSVGDKGPKIDVDHWLRGAEIECFDDDRIYVLAFWATWCKYCLVELPRMNDLAARYRDRGVVVAAVSDEDLQTVVGFLMEPEWRDQLLNLTIATDPDKSVQRDFMSAAAIESIPTVFIIGRDRRIEWIGHPEALDATIGAIVEGTWDRDAFRETHEERMAPTYARHLILRKMRKAYRNEDWNTLMALLDEAIATVDEAGPFKVQKFLLMIGEMNQAEEGYVYGMQVLREHWDDARVLNMLAWFVIKNHAVRVRNLDFALRAARRASELTDNRHAAILDTLARVYFEQGELDEALRWQRRAVASLREDDPFERAIRAALKRYERAAADRQQITPQGTTP